MLDADAHGLTLEPTRVQFYRELEAFLEEHMQPREEPVAEATRRALRGDSVAARP